MLNIHLFGLQQLIKSQVKLIKWDFHEFEFENLYVHYTVCSFLYVIQND